MTGTGGRAWQATATPSRPAHPLNPNCTQSPADHLKPHIQSTLCAEGPTQGPAAPITRNPACPSHPPRREPSSAVGSLELSTKSPLPPSKPRSILRGPRRPSEGPRQSHRWPSDSAEIQRKPTSSYEASRDRRLSVSHEGADYRAWLYGPRWSGGDARLGSRDSAGNPADDGPWDTETGSDSYTGTDSSSTQSDNEASASMQLAMAHEAARWFPHTNIYAKMKASAESAVDKEQKYKDAVTGRVRIGGSILTIFLFICVTQRQSSLEDIPLAAFEMGGLRFIAWAFLLTCFCSLPIMIADIALGQSTQGSVLSALNSLHKRLRGLGLAMAASCTVAAVLQTYVTCLVFHFLTTSISTLSNWMSNDTFRNICANLSAAECAADPRCAVDSTGGCLAALEVYINASWLHLLTSTDTTTRVYKVACCLAIWVLVTYALTQAPRVLAAVGACVFPCIFILLPALALMEMTSAEQKKHLTDIFKVLSHEMPLQEEYFCLLMLPLLLYMPGDGAALTVASFDKPSHNPVLIGFVCLTSKWLVAYMLFYLLFYAEGLSSDPQSFNGMFLPSMFRWMTAGGPGSTAFPVMWYVVTRMWPQAWFLGLISFVAIFAQRLSSCWCLMMVQWSVLQDMRWLTVPPKVHECLSDPRGLLLSLPRAAESRDRDMSVPRRDAEPYPTNAVLGPLRNDAVPQENPSGLSQKPGSTQKKPLEGCHVRQRRSSSKDEKISGSANGRGALSRLVWSLNRLLRRSAGDTYEDVDPQDMFDAKQEAMTNAPLSWWGGPDAEDPEKHRRGEAGKKGYRLKKFLLACIVYGPPATVSALLVCCSLPADTAENPRFTAPLHFHMMRHTDMFLRLLLGSVTCIHLAWLFGFREQAQRVGILPLLVLGLSSVSMMLVPLVRVLFSVDLSVSLVMLLWLPWAFIGLTVLIVSVQTAHNLRDILEQHRGPPAKRNRRPPGTRVPRKGLHRSGARSLSLRARTMPFLARDGGSSCNSREDQHFVHSKIWSLERPGSLLCMGEESLPPKVTHSRLLQPQRKGFKHGHPRQQIRRAAWVQARVREMFAVISLFVRLLRSNLYWAFIGNVEILRADLNMALSGNPCRPVPMLWGWLFKFVATPWLLVELVEHCVGTFPKALQQAEGFSVATAYILFGWTIVIVSIIVFGKHKRHYTTSPQPS